MNVKVKWLKSPIRYGFPKSLGDCSLIDKKRADELSKIDPNLFKVLEIEKPVKVKDTAVKKSYTRPVIK
jgi:hypothetical protein